VVRHSRARTCTVRITPNSVEVIDDGTAAESGPGSPHQGASPPEGHGLAGLRERVVHAGGHLLASHLPGGGFRLYAEVPPTAQPPAQPPADTTVRRKGVS
jgi:two-component system sensor histidine kinase DesK